MSKQSLWHYNITYCINKDCPHNDCHRRRENVPPGWCVSLADLKIMDGDKCRYYMEGDKSGKR